MAERGINLVGHVTSNLGLGVAARNTAALLAQMDVAFAAVDVATTLPTGRATDAPLEKLVALGELAPYSANLYHMNPPELRAEIGRKPAWFRADGRANAIVPFWELSKLPPAWVDVMRRCDVVLAPTRFIAEMARAADLGAGVEIVHFPQTCAIPDGVAPDRERWGFAAGDVVFISSFDLASDLSRKNPAAAVEAFREMRAGLDLATATRAKLVLKVNNPKGDKSQAGRLADLASLADGDPAIRVIAESLSYPETLALYASADVFLSLHRAEGLGLGLLEAMMLGLPVIATGYSGNLDFMTPADSRLVGYQLVPVTGTSIGSYDPRVAGEGQLWAEPQVADAARAMAELTDDATRAALGRAAREAALATRANPQRRAAILRLLERAENPAARSALTELQSLPGWYWRARQVAGATLRGLGLRR